MSCDDGMDVLRGIVIDAAPVRLGRGARPAAVTASAGTLPDPEEEAVRRGYQAGLEQGRAEGLRAGHAEGVRRGAEEAAAQAQAAADQAAADARAALDIEREKLRSLAAALEGTMAQCLAAAEDDMLAICYEAVCRVVAAEVLRPEVVRAHLLALLSQSGSAAAMHLHPQDAALLEAHAPGEEGQRLRWVADPEVALGGCLLVKRGGGLDARLETTLAACKTLLAEERARRASAGKAMQ